MTEATNAALVERLERSRATLLEALTERTEADFARALGGAYGEEPLGRVLAALAEAERSDLAIARSEARPRREPPEKPLPPQVTHDLAGARHQTLVHLEELDSAAAETLVTAITEREAALAAAINAILEPPVKPALKFPVI